MRRRPLYLKALAAVVLLSDVIPAMGDDEYLTNVQPYMNRYCLECHNSSDPRGDLDFSKFNSSADVIAAFRRWNHVIEFIQGGQMPPEDSPRPSVTESNLVVHSIRSILIADAARNAGDPGVIPPRRLSNSEFNYSIRDLTGVDICPTRDFPADPAGGEGFDNTGEALGTSPNLVRKYLGAAQLVADHLVLRTNGVSFAPFPVTSYNERTKLTEQAILDFYEQHSVDLHDYFEAAWRYRHRTNGLDLPIEQWAAQELSAPAASSLSRKYLGLIWNRILTSPDPAGIVAEIQEAFTALPAADQLLTPPSSPDDSSEPPDHSSVVDSTLLRSTAEVLRSTAEFERLIAIVEQGKYFFNEPEGELIKPNAGNWPISHLDFRAKTTAARDQFDPSVLKTDTEVYIGRIEAPESTEEQTPQRMFLRVDPAFGANGGTVIFDRIVVSRSDEFPRNAEEESKQSVQSLRTVLETLNPAAVSGLPFGRHPDGSSLDPHAIALNAPDLLEISFSAELRRQLDGYFLLAKCHLDQKSPTEAAVFVEASENDAPDGEFDGSEELLANPESQAAETLRVSASQFCDVFPNRFYYADPGRGLSAGFHLVEGFYRDDQPLADKVLSDSERAELNQLWTELHFVTQSSETLLRGFVWFERSEREVLHDKRFDFLRAEDPALVEDDMLNRFEKLYLDKLGVHRVEDSLEARDPGDTTYQMVHRFFQEIRQGLASYRTQLFDAETKALVDLEQLAQRAWKRPLHDEDRQSLRALYKQLRDDQLEPESAIRAVFMSILMSPEFSFLLRETPETVERSPLKSRDLANRLSYFLWSSLPDEQLMWIVDNGQLQTDEQLLNQTRRMLKDPKIAAFSNEFFGQWLRYRDYLEKDPILPDAFPEYDDELRKAMIEEPSRLAQYLIQEDRDVTELLTSDLTFVNERLARHYGGTIEDQYRKQFEIRKLAQRSSHIDEHNGERGDERTRPKIETWFPVSGLSNAGRGGWPGMAVILTKNSAGERTSPVKRGFWTVHHLLGQHFPPPPADVQELPKSEKHGDKSIRQMLEAHVADTQCAMCHKHFDGVGIAMEGFDAIGRRRSVDLGGRPIDDTGVMSGGEKTVGIPELTAYLVRERRDEFLQTLCRKFLGYALGRSVQLSDEPLVDEMTKRLKENNYRFSILFETVVLSPQFRTQRGTGQKTAATGN
ncbi:MAG: DUF1592 domain-containing protein [Planctomyces sp.]|nr:DUF1592 domain-containing protein [Planctomyces sp.]